MAAFEDPTEQIGLTAEIQKGEKAGTVLLRIIDATKAAHAHHQRTENLTMTLVRINNEISRLKTGQYPEDAVRHAERLAALEMDRDKLVVQLAELERTPLFTEG